MTNSGSAAAVFVSVSAAAADRSDPWVDWAFGGVTAFVGVVGALLIIAAIRAAVLWINRRWIGAHYGDTPPPPIGEEPDDPPTLDRGDPDDRPDRLDPDSLGSPPGPM